MHPEISKSYEKEHVKGISLRNGKDLVEPYVVKESSNNEKNKKYKESLPPTVENPKETYVDVIAPLSTITQCTNLIPQVSPEKISSKVRKGSLKQFLSSWRY